MEGEPEQVDASETAVKEEVEEEEGPPPGWQTIPPPEAHTSPPTTPLPPTAPEMGQMVCGSCRRLLSYPKGVRHVECSSCKTANYVLEAQEVGLVNCGSCSILLMYPFGASSIQCSSCHFVTEIGEENKRPPWSEIQGYPPLPPNPVS